MGKRQTSRVRGFTLVEILVVVVILGIAAAVIAPQIGTQADLRVAAASRVVIADLLYAQNRAIATQSYHYVIYDPATQSYSMYYLSGGVLMPVQEPVTLGPYTTTFNSGALADTSVDTFSIGGAQGIVFDELGTPHVYDPTVTAATSLNVGAALGTAGTIQIQSDSRTATISIEPDTGQMTVQ